jgi:hypothetical protein
MNTDGSLTYDKFEKPIEGFRCDEILTVSNTFSPELYHMAFRVPVDTTYYFDSASTQLATIKANSITIVNYAKTYTFAASMNIEVMGRG